MTDPQKRRLVRLVETLLARTEKGDMQWDETVEDFVYEHSLPRATVQIESVDRDDAPPYMLRVLNSSGKEVEALASSDKSLVPPEKSKFTELYALAKRSALGTDEVIDGLFEDLGIEES